jgi:hypothetical protein
MKKLMGGVAVVAASLAAIPVAGVGASPSDDDDRRFGPNTREFEGTVVSVNRDARRFRLRDTERGTVRIKVTRNTRFERINGLAGLKVGMRNVESVVRRSDGRWIALEVERSGGGGEHGGRDDDDDRDDRDDDDNSGPGGGGDDDR